MSHELLSTVVLAKDIPEHHLHIAMPIPEDTDTEKLAEIALAMLLLTAHAEGPWTRAWKGMDWDVTDLLFERGWILDPKGKAKSVVFTDEGLELAEKYFEKHFGGGSK